MRLIIIRGRTSFDWFKFPSLTLNSEKSSPKCLNIGVEGSFVFAEKCINILGFCFFMMQPIKSIKAYVAHRVTKNSGGGYSIDSYYYKC
jgi:hypothetical protein